jgi:hypothetical protein
LIRVRLATADRGLALEAVRSFVRRGYARVRVLGRPCQWRLASFSEECWTFEWIEEDKRIKLTIDQLQLAVSLREQGLPYRHIAARFGVGVDTAFRAIAGFERPL